MVLIQSKKKNRFSFVFPKIQPRAQHTHFCLFLPPRSPNTSGHVAPLFAHSNQLALPRFSRKGSTLEFVTHAGSLLSFILTVAV